MSLKSQPTPEESSTGRSQTDGPHRTHDAAASAISPSVPAFVPSFSLAEMPGAPSGVDDELMDLAICAASNVRTSTSPNPWVGAALRVADGRTFVGATQPPGGAHAEVMAINAALAAGADLEGATLASTLEPCSHYGRTPPCASTIAASGISRVLIGVLDPDSKVCGKGVDILNAAAVEVSVGVRHSEVTAQLLPYLTHRKTGRPFVVCKLASTLDGQTAAPDGTSKWITSDLAREDVHRLRSECDAILVGAGTVRADNPSLTVRDSNGVDAGRQPLRVVLGAVDPTAKVHPCWERSGELEPILDEIGAKGVVQLLVEGGAAVAGAFHRAGLVDRFVVYVAPVLLGGDDGSPLLAGSGASTMTRATRGHLESVAQFGPDVRLIYTPPDRWWNS